MIVVLAYVGVSQGIAISKYKGANDRHRAVAMAFEQLRYHVNAAGFFLPAEEWPDEVRRQIDSLPATVEYVAGSRVPPGVEAAPGYWETLPLAERVVFIDCEPVAPLSGIALYLADGSRRVVSRDEIADLLARSCP